MSVESIPADVDKSAKFENLVAKVYWLRFQELKGLGAEIALLGRRRGTHDYNDAGNRIRAAGGPWQTRVCNAQGADHILNRIISFTVREHDLTTWLFNLRIKYHRHVDNLPANARQLNGERVRLQTKYQKVRGAWIDALEAEILTQKAAYDNLTGLMGVKENQPRALVAARELKVVRDYKEKIKETTLLTKRDDIHQAPEDVDDPFAEPGYAESKSFFVDLPSTAGRRAIWSEKFSSNAVLLVYEIFDCLKTVVNLYYQALREPKGAIFFGTIVCQLLDDNWRHVVRKQMANEFNLRPETNMEIRERFHSQVDPNTVYTNFRNLSAKFFSGADFPGIDLIQIPIGGRGAGSRREAAAEEFEDDMPYDEAAGGAIAF